MDEVRCEVEIEASTERVWSLITEPQHVKVWYAFDGAEVDLRVGGVIEHVWEEHGRFLGRIDVLERPHRLGYRYANVPDELPASGRSTHVLFELTALGTGLTRVTVTESGLDQLELSEADRAAYREVTTQGWNGGLSTLARHAMEDRLTQCRSPDQQGA